MVSVYQLDGKESSKDFLSNADQEGLIKLHRISTPPQGSVFIEKNAICACSNHAIVVNNKDTITVVKGEHQVAGFPAYVLPPDCDDEEALAVVAWLTRHQFHTFTSKIEDGSLVRKLEPCRFFRKIPHQSCEICESYELIGDPVFFLKHIVLSKQNKGPTLESSVRL